MKTYCTTTISALTITGLSWSTQIFGEIEANRAEALRMLKTRAAKGLDLQDNWNEPLEFAMIVSVVDGNVMKQTFVEAGLEALALCASPVSGKA